MSQSRARYVKIALLAAGITQADIARELGVSRQTVNGVVNGTRISERVRVHIAKRLGLPFDQLWGRPPKPAKTTHTGSPAGDR